MGKPSPGKDVTIPASLPGHPQPFYYCLQTLKPSQVTVKGDYLVLLCLVSCPRVVPSVTAVLWRFRGMDPGRAFDGGLQ